MNNSYKAEQDEMEAIVRALEASPHVSVPEDFAVRVMVRVPQRPQRRFVLRQSLQTEGRVGRKLALVALIVLVGGMLLMAPHTRGSESWMVLQGLLFAQLMALLLWMGISYKRLP